MTDDEFVRFVQVELKKRGHYAGAIDGIAGPGSKAGLMAAIGDAVAQSIPATEPEMTGWDARSAKNLVGVHSDLVKIANRARVESPVKFVVIEGVRTRERQEQLVASGASRTMNSRHIPGKDGTAKAIDIAPLDANGKIVFDWPLYHKIAPAMKQAAKDLGIPLEWGGDWRTFKDGPHFQLPYRTHP